MLRFKMVRYTMVNYIQNLKFQKGKALQNGTWFQTVRVQNVTNVTKQYTVTIRYDTKRYIIITVEFCYGLVWR
jgi:hypothetical protein